MTKSPGAYYNACLDSSPGRSGGGRSRKSSLNSPISTPRTSHLRQTPDQSYPTPHRRRASSSLNGSIHSINGIVGGSEFDGSGAGAGGGAGGGLGFASTGANGLGSLADELADAWDEGGCEEGDESMEFSRLESQFDGIKSSRASQHRKEEEEEQEGQNERRVDFGSPVHEAPLPNSSPPSQAGGRNAESPAKHVRRPSRPQNRKQAPRRRASDTDDLFDREGGNGDRLRRESNGLTPSMEARLMEIERLAQQGLSAIDRTDPGDIDNEDQEEDGKVVERVLNGLRDLPGQAEMEGESSR